MGADADDASIFYDVGNGTWNSSSAQDSVTERTGKRVVTGLVFDMRVRIKGSITINANFLISGDPQEAQMSWREQCNKDTLSFQDDANNYFAYQF